MSGPRPSTFWINYGPPGSGKTRALEADAERRGGRGILLESDDGRCFRLGETAPASLAVLQEDRPPDWILVH